MAQSITVTDKSTHQATTVTGHEASLSSARSIVQLSLSHSQIKALARHGNDLVITTADGQTIVLHGFFADGPGHSDLVVQDGGGLWLVDLSDMGSLPMDTSVDTASSNVFSSIDAIDPLFSSNATDASSATAVVASGDDTGSSGDPFGLEMLPVAVGLGGFGLTRISSGGSQSGFSAGPNVSQNPNGTLTVSGKVQAGDTVTITYPDGSTNSVTADANGYYVITSKGIQSSGIISMFDTDANGNTTTAAQYWNDHTAPQAPGVSAVKANADGTVTVTGTAEAGSHVTVTFADGKTATATAGSDGKYSAQSSSAETASGAINVTATDMAGNHSAATAVSLVTQTSTTDTSTGIMTVTGSAQAYSNVTVTFADGSTATGTADSTGKYSIPSTTAETGSVTVTAATALPPAPTVSSVNANSDGTVTVAGSVTSGTTVIATFADGSQAVGAVDSSTGNYSVQSHTPETVSGPISVTVIDSLGNASTAASTMSVTQTSAANTNGTMTVTGMSAPGSTVMVTYADGHTASGTASPDGSYTVTSSGAESGAATVTSTNLMPHPPAVSAVTANPDGSVTVAGMAVPDSTVTVTYADGSTLTGTAGADGTFSISNGTSAPVSATASYATAGGASSTTPITSVTGTSTTDTSTGIMTVTGKAAPGSPITVTFADGHTATTTANANGNYNVSSSNAETGTFTVLAVSPPPAAPTITEVVTNSDSTTGTLSVLGTTTPYNTVTVTYSDKTTSTGTADSSGKFTVQSSTAETGAVQVTVTDALGHTSPSITAAMPTVTTSTDASTGIMTVSGTAAPNSAMIVTFADKTQATGTSNPDGSYSIPSTTAESGSVYVAMISTVSPPAMPTITKTTSNTDNTLTIKGTATANTTVTVTFPDGSTMPGTVDGSGNYSVKSASAQSQGGTVSVVDSDSNGNHSLPFSEPWGPVTSSSDSTAASTAASMAITGVQHNNDGTVTVSGTAAPDSTVTVTFPDASASTVTVTADSNGNWGNATSSVAEPSGKIDATATDASGHNISATPYEYTAASTATTGTTITAITPDTGVSGDFITANGSLTVNGTNSALPSGDTVQVSLDGHNWHTATVDATSGAQWSFDNTASTLQDGLYLLQVHVADALGKAVGQTSVQEVEVSASGTLNLGLTDVLNDVKVLADAGSNQQITINSGGGIVSTVHLTEGVGTGATQWQDTGTTTVKGVTYDVYHNAAQGSNTAADLLIQHGITVI